MTLALTATGLMYTWGFGKSGSLGLGEVSNSMSPQMIEQLASNDECKDMVDISCGS
jgi:alpha-tubulin suppressor-like RCC1 family protein